MADQLYFRPADMKDLKPLEQDEDIPLEIIQIERPFYASEVDDI